VAGVRLVLRTTDLPASDRFAVWHDAIRDSFMPYRVRTPSPADFHAQIREFRCDHLHMHELLHPSIEAYRSERHIRQSDPELYYLSVNIRGSVRIEHLNRVVELEPGGLVLYDSSHPFRSSTVDGGRLAAGLTVSFPRDALPLPERVVRQILNARIDGRRGMGRLLVRYLRELARNGDHYDPTERQRLSAITLDLMAAALTGRSSGPDRMVLTRVYAFIREHLADPRLDPGSVAAAQGMSVRSLHRLFAPTGVGVGAWIRRERLSRCHRELTDPALRGELVATIGARWGFADPAHFSRAFRNAYGMSPVEARRLTPGA